MVSKIKLLTLSLTLFVSFTVYAVDYPAKISDSTEPKIITTDSGTVMTVIPKTKKVTKVEYSIGKSSEISFVERKGNDLYEFYCLSIGVPNQSTESSNCISESYNKKDLNHSLVKPKTIDREKVQVITLPVNTQLDTVSFEINKDKHVVPVYTYKEKLNDSIAKSYTFIRIDPVSNYWNGQEIFVMKEVFE